MMKKVFAAVALMAVGAQGIKIRQPLIGGAAEECPGQVGAILDEHYN